MKIDVRAALAGLLLSCVLAVPAFAGISPYVRIEGGGNELRMTDGDHVIMNLQSDLQAAGYDAHFSKVGSAYGPAAAAGVWLFPGFRIGATYSYQKATVRNRLHVPGQIFVAEDLDFRMREIGAEAALRFTRLHGLLVGANVATGRAQMVEGLSDEELAGQLYIDNNAEKTKTTFGGFIGFEQTNPAGFAGFVRAGFQYRDMGRMPNHSVVSDGVSSVASDGRTIWLDYSGFYLKVGMGFDLVR